jgi:phosphoglycolate phosphatase
MKKYKLLIFDCDGTLVDSNDLVASCAQDIARELQIPIPDISIIRAGLGMLLKDFCEHVFPNYDWQIIRDMFYRYYTPENLAKHFFHGALETLVTLRHQGFILAMATNTSRAKIEAMLTQANSTQLFATLRCGDDGCTKPDPQMLYGLLDELGIKKEDALMIGDTHYDMQLAKNAAVDVLAVAYGHESPDMFAAYKPIGYLNDIRELQDMFKK